MACLDTTVFLDLSGRGGAAVRTRAQDVLRDVAASDEGLTTTRSNLAELYVGVARSRRPQRELERMQQWLSDVTVLDFDDAAARIFGAVVGSLLDSGRPIADMDALIASVALLNDQTFVTRNPRHFTRVPGLRVRTY